MKKLILSAAFVAAFSIVSQAQSQDQPRRLKVMPATERAVNKSTVNDDGTLKQAEVQPTTQAAAESKNNEAATTTKEAATEPKKQEKATKPH